MCSWPDLASALFASLRVVVYCIRHCVLIFPSLVVLVSARSEVACIFHFRRPNQEEMSTTYIGEPNFHCVILSMRWYRCCISEMIERSSEDMIG